MGHKECRLLTSLLLAGIFLVGVPDTRAASCADQGMFESFISTTSTLTPGSNALVEARFKWRPAIDPSCYDNNVTVYFYGSKPGGSNALITTGPLGKLGLGDVKTAELRLTYEQALDIAGSSGGISLTAKAISGDTYATSNAIGITLQGGDTAYACVDSSGKFACSADKTQDGCKRNFACQPGGNPRDSNCRPIPASQCGQTAQCKLENAYWPGPAITGSAIRITVAGKGCTGFQAAINVFKDRNNKMDLFITNPVAVFKSDTQADGQLVFDKSDFEKVYIGGVDSSENEGKDDKGNPTMQIYFVADAGGSTFESNHITFVNTGGTRPTPSPTGTTPTSTGPGGQTITFDFSIPNPLKSENLLDLIKNVGDFIFTLAIPIAVIMIIYAGVMFLTSRGNQEQVTKARNILWYAVIGLAIVLIGSGFVSLVTSILNLGSDSGTTGDSSSTRDPLGQSCNENPDTCPTGYFCFMGNCAKED